MKCPQVGRVFSASDYGPWGPWFYSFHYHTSIISIYNQIFIITNTFHIIKWQFVSSNKLEVTIILNFYPSCHFNLPPRPTPNALTVKPKCKHVHAYILLSHIHNTYMYVFCITYILSFSTLLAKSSDIWWYFSHRHLGSVGQCRPKKISCIYFFSSYF